MKKFTAIALEVVLFASCTTDEQRFNNEIAEIEDYISSTGLDFLLQAQDCITISHRRAMSTIPTARTKGPKHIGYLLDSTIFSAGGSLQCICRYLSL